ncbi:double zinc ribbon domain-containing protein [Polymorphobacter sp.]|uniref:double zinc ribbon domain-containing protein n=1 Tax=Polymorphobacter sp. TaxID=1909290 RepID=UPI003F6ED3E2
MDLAGIAKSSALQPLAALFDLVLPPRCAGCGVIVDGDGRFCGGCWQGLDFLGSPQCESCGTPFAYDRGTGVRCGACEAAPPPWGRARAALAYQGAARTALLRFKLADRQHLAAMMVPHMARAGAGLLGPAVLLVPVPLHRWRLWRRGFNQSALLARGLARAGLGVLHVDALVRVRPTLPSVGLNPSERAANVKGAFVVPRPERIVGRNVVLVDDVLTSGATASACASSLLQAGAATVDVLTWARVVRDRV